jgi:flagellar motor switch protein FliG
MQKIGALLMNMEKSAAAEVLKHFSEDNILAIGEAMKDLDGMDIPREEMARIYREFKVMMRARAGVFRPRDRDVDEIFSASLGEKAEEIVHELNRRKMPISSYFKKLAGFPSEILTGVLKDEHPQTIALVLSNIDSNKAAQVLTELEEELRLDIITRIAKLKSPPESVNLNIAMKLEAKAKQAMVKDDPEEALGRLKTVADVLNRVDKEMEQQVLGKISETDADMAEEIKELMFTFDDLLLVDKRAIQKILSGINVQALAMALKGANQSVESYIMGNVSQRVKKLIEDEKELLGPKPMEEVVSAQKEIVATVRALIESGEITISRSTEEELVV